MNFLEKFCEFIGTLQTYVRKISKNLYFLNKLDSKTLTEKDREKIYEKIKEENKFCGYAIKVLSPNTISTGMLSRYL
jgi:ribonuclease HII